MVVPPRWRWVAFFVVVAGGQGQQRQPQSSDSTISGSNDRLVFQLRRTAQATPRDPRNLAAHHSESHACKLGNYDNVQYHMIISVGGDCKDGTKQSFSVVPDTGSSDLWIPASNCSRCRSSGAKYSPTTSCSSVPIGDRIHFKYGDGTVAAGVSLRDVVWIGDLKVPNQFLIQVDRMEATTHMRSDGILGLAHHYDDQDGGDDAGGAGGKTFVATLFRENPSLQPMFSFYLTGTNEESSQVVFGDPDISRYAKDREFKYGKAYYMENTELWLTSVWSIGWSDTGVEASFPERGTLGAPALIDSGSSLIVLTPELYEKLMGELKWRLSNCRDIEEQSIVMCDCPPAHDLNGIPSLVINIIDDRDQQFGLCMSPDEYILQSVDPISGMSTCVPALQRGTDSQPVPMIFGMTFMRSFYTNFDVKNHRIGFARSSVSPMASGTVCSVYTQPILRRIVWLASVAMAIMSVVFACYVFFVPKSCSGADQAQNSVAPVADDSAGNAGASRLIGNNSP